MALSVVDPESCRQCRTRPEPSLTGKHDQPYLKTDRRPDTFAVKEGEHIARPRRNRQPNPAQQHHCYGGSDSTQHRPPGVSHDPICPSEP